MGKNCSDNDGMLGQLTIIKGGGLIVGVSSFNAGSSCAIWFTPISSARAPFRTKEQRQIITILRSIIEGKWPDVPVAN